MDPTRIEWITTSRGKKSPILDGFQFRVNKHLNNGKSYWKCVRTDVCSVTLVTNEDRFWSLKGEHPHGKNDLEIERKRITNVMKRKVLENPLEPIPKVSKSSVVQWLVSLNFFFFRSITIRE